MFGSNPSSSDIVARIASQAQVKVTSAGHFAGVQSLEFLTSRIRGKRRSAMTLTALRGMTRKALVSHAKKQQIAGCQQMTKDELVAALSTRLRRTPNGSPRNRSESRRAATNGHTKTNGRNGVDPATKSAHRTVGGSHLNGHRLLKSSAAPTAPGNVQIGRAHV